MKGRIRPVQLINRNGLIRLIAGVLIGLVSLAGTVYGLDAATVMKALAAASSGWISLALLGVIGVALAKTARWAALYPPSTSPVSFWGAFTILMGTQMVNILIPIRLGELIRIGLMKQAGQPAAVTLSTIVVEKVLDLAAAALVVVSLITLAVTPAWLQEQVRGILLVSGIMVAGLGWLIWARRYLASTWEAIPGPALPRQGQQALAALGAGLEALDSLSQPRVLGRIIFWTGCTWLLSLLTMVALLAAFDLRLPLTAAVVMMLAVSSSNILPSPPALIGVMHLIAVVVLGQYGVARPLAVGVGTALNAVTVLPLIILGSGALWLQLTPLQSWLRQRSPGQVGVE